jgi:hypothetical protein
MAPAKHEPMVKNESVGENLSNEGEGNRTVRKSIHKNSRVFENKLSGS